MKEKKETSPLSSNILESYERLAAIYAEPDFLYTINLGTGYPSLDGITQGFKKQEITVIAGRTSMGKTALGLSFAYNIARKGKKVGFISLESSQEAVMDKLLALSMGVDLSKLEKGHCSLEEFSAMGDALEHLSHTQIFLKTPYATSDISFIKELIVELSEENKVDIIFIDYVQLIKSGNIMNRSQELSDIIAQLKGMSQKHNIPIVVLSQLSRHSESRPDKRPYLSDMRDSGSIEEDADVVMMLYRDEYYNDFSEEPGVVSIFVRKNRNGKTWQCNLLFRNKFFEIEKNIESSEIEVI